MKTFVFLCILGLLAIAARGDTLRAIEIVEDWQHHVGKAGELGPYQMLPGTRADRRRELLARGILNPTEHELAVAQLDWITARLTAAGVDPRPFNLALCWNAGVKGTITGRAPERSYEYARRVVALLEATP